MKSVLLLIHADVGQEARLRTALDLVRALQGHLVCLEVVAFPTRARDVTGMAADLILTKECHAAADNRRLLEVRLAREDIVWTWIDTAGAVADCLLREAGLADLIVVNCKRDHWLSTDPRAAAATLALKARCPVVATPDHVRGLDPTGPVVVGWDGSAPIMATLRAAAPLLKLSRQVRLVTVGEGQGVGPEAAALYLERHGVAVQVTCCAALGQDPDAVLLRICAEDKAVYCLIGAYGHGRLSEDLFGGVTRRMLDAAVLPLVLGH
ncbi:universal stress family protein [Caulobacter sp. AP07]|uniref:universal stress protein n=1 Tax=Caulobacter sp. AP07 TaxID=1144304 RepID=UPI000271E3B3|nr:universal stress protein [Caulobacter sp. AP07]EJL33013.1 universal stress family protein [Caulobacter sp. AP07]